MAGAIPKPGRRLAPAGAVAGKPAAAARMHQATRQLCVPPDLRGNVVLAGQRQVPIQLHGRLPARRREPHGPPFFPNTSHHARVPARSAPINQNARGNQSRKPAIPTRRRPRPCSCRERETGRRRLFRPPEGRTTIPLHKRGPWNGDALNSGSAHRRVAAGKGLPGKGNDSRRLPALSRKPGNPCTKQSGKEPALRIGPNQETTPALPHGLAGPVLDMVRPTFGCFAAGRADQGFTPPRKASNSSSLIGTVCSGPDSRPNPHPPGIPRRPQSARTAAVPTQARGFGVSVDLAAAGLVVPAVAADILGEEILRIGMLTGAHAQHDQRGILGQELGHAIRHDLMLCGKHADFLKFPYVAPQRQRLVSRLANRSPASPGDVARNQADTAHNRQMVVAQQLLDVI